MLGLRIVTGLYFPLEICYPFLWISVMRASFHAYDSVPYIMDLLNITYKGTFIVLNSFFSTHGWNPSGSAYLETYQLFSFFSTRSGVIITSLTFLSLSHNRCGICAFPGEHTSEVKDFCLFMVITRLPSVCNQDLFCSLPLTCSISINRLGVSSD